MRQKLKKIELRVDGMHCASCAVSIERRLLKIPGVEQAKVDHTSGRAVLHCAGTPDLDTIRARLAPDGYTVSPWSDKVPARRLFREDTRRKFGEIAVILLFLLAVHRVLTQFDLAPRFGLSDDMSYGLVLLMGLTASVSSCIAVTGGLLLAIAARFNAHHPELSGLRKLKPQLWFNAGRILSYTVLGGAVGALGSVLTLSPRANGVLTLVVSLAMVLLGLQLLQLFPRLGALQPRMPKFLAHRILGMAEREGKVAPFLLGGATFFMPCGFTQALQLYVLSRGDVWTGAATMLVFSVGTLPALLSVGALSSFAKGTFQRYFLKFSGVLVILLGVTSIGSGLTLAGVDPGLTSILPTRIADADDNVREAAMVNGRQIVDMKVVGLSYSPHRFRVRQGVPVEWRIDGQAATGCARVIVIPKLGRTEYLNDSGLTVVRFTPAVAGTIDFSCPMGMTTGGAGFTVTPDVARTAQTGTAAPDGPPPLPPGAPVQKLSMEVSAARGFYPSAFTVRKGIPVELTVHDEVPLGGCMSVMTIPKYNAAVALKVGDNRLVFTPTEPGVVPVTCSMGSPMAQINVTG